MEFTGIISIFTAIFLTIFLIGSRLLAQGKKNQANKSVLRKENVFGSFTNALAGVLPHSEKKLNDLSKELIAAGRYDSAALNNFLAIRNVCLMMILLFFAFLFVADLAVGNEWLVAAIGLISVVMTYSVPRLILVNRGKHRIRQIEKAIPDALDMIAMSMASGLPLNRALDRVSSELQGSHCSLASELRIIANQTKSGSHDLAFSNFADRIDLPEVVSLCAIMRQSQRLGGKLVEALTSYANRIRDDRKRRAEQAGNTASIKLLLPVVICLAPPIFILLIGPAILDLREFINRERDSSVELIESVNATQQQIPDVRNSQSANPNQNQN